MVATSDCVCQNESKNKTNKEKDVYVNSRIEVCGNVNHNKAKQIERVREYMLNF